MSFIIVKFGNNEHKLFNPQCPSQVLLDCIREQCNTDFGVMVDLSDTFGNIKNLNDNLTSYANVFLEGRETYWLIRIDKGVNENEPTKYSLLLSDPDTVCPDLYNKLQDLSRPKTTKGHAGSWMNAKKKVTRAGKVLAATARTNLSSGSSKGKR